MLKFYKLIVFVFCLSFPYIASSETINSPHILNFNFQSDHEQWVGEFSDYPKGQESFFDLAWGWENIPIKQEDRFSAPKGIFLAGNNHSDDLFMFVKKQISNLKPNTVYAITFNLEIATDVPKGLMGIGGSPGESVVVKVGASSKEPRKTLIQNQYRLNVDKGNQFQGGKNAVVVGDLANVLIDQDHIQYKLKSMDNFKKPLLIKSNEDGSIWIFIGTDSGFEGPSKYYIAKVKVSFLEHAPNQI